MTINYCQSGFTNTDYMTIFNNILLPIAYEVRFSYKKKKIKIIRIKTKI